MKKLLLASVITLAPFTAFAGGFVAAGDVNQSSTSAASNAGVNSQQGTAAGAAAYKGSVVVGTVSGNYTSVNTGAAAVSGPKGSATSTTAQQTNIGGTISGGSAHGQAGGISGGSQSSTGSGSSGASASNQNLGGFVSVKSWH